MKGSDISSPSPNVPIIFPINSAKLCFTLTTGSVIFSTILVSRGAENEVIIRNIKSIVATFMDITNIFNSTSWVYIFLRILKSLLYRIDYLFLV